MRLRFGDSIDIERGFLAAGRRAFDSSEEWVEQINERIWKVILASAKHSNREHPDAHGAILRLDDIEIGDYVLVKYPNGPPTKLHAPYRGPMMVLEKIRDEGLLVQDIVTQMQLQVSNDRVKKFIKPPGFGLEDA